MGIDATKPMGELTFEFERAKEYENIDINRYFPNLNREGEVDETS